MIEKEITVEIDGNTLAGTVCLPDSQHRVPIVLFVHGSGPLDRNENAKGFKLNVFNKMAHYLASYGIGSLRYDKRGCGKSTGDYLNAGHADFVSDVRGVISFLMESNFSDRRSIYVLGHSEGAIIAPQVAQSNTAVAGIILLCPFAQPLTQVLRNQAKQIKKDIEDLRGIKGKFVRLITHFFGDPILLQDKIIDRIEQSTTSTIKYKFKKLNAKWFRELFNLDVVNVYRRTDCPMLIIGGEKDIQCRPADVERIRNLVSGRAEAHILGNMTHILRRDLERPSFFNYERVLIKQDIDEKVLQLTQQWLEKQICKTSGQS